MGCSSPVSSLVLAKDATVWSKGGTAPGTSDPFWFTDESIEQIAPMLQQVRATLLLSNSSVDTEVQAVFQTTSDGVTWDTVQSLSSWYVGNSSATSAWYTSTDNFKRAIRFGVQIRQANSSTSVQFSRVTLIVDLQVKA